jgi:hypothetical protein
MSLTLRINQDPNTLVPGQVIDGVSGWRLDDAPKDAVLRLFWFTEGKGTCDVGVVEELTLPHHLAELSGTFRFTIPAAPYSFCGQLITLKWAIELLVDKGDLVERLDLIVSPWVEQVSLKKVE